MEGLFHTAYRVNQSYVYSGKPTVRQKWSLLAYSVLRTLVRMYS